MRAVQLNNFWASLRSLRKLGEAISALLRGSLCDRNSLWYKITSTGFAFVAMTILGGKLLAMDLDDFVPPKEGPASESAPLKAIKVSEINANLFSNIYDFIQESATSLFEGFVSLKDFVETGEWLIASLQSPEMQSQISSFGLRLILSLFLSLVVAGGLSYWLKPKILVYLQCKNFDPNAKIKSLSKALILSILSPLSFGFLLYTLFRLLNPKDGVYLELVSLLSSGAATIWIILNIAHLFLRPPSPKHQHLPLPKAVLEKQYQWFRRIGLVALFGFFAHEIGLMIYLPPAGERLLVQGTALIITIMATIMVLSLRSALSIWIRKERTKSNLSKLRRGLLYYLEYSYLPLIVLIVISYISWVTHTLDNTQVFIWKLLLTLALFPLLRYGTHCIKKARLLYLHRNLRRLSSTFTERGIFYGRQIDFVFTLLMFGIAAVLVLDMWGLNPSFFLFSNVGRLLAEKALSIFVIIIVALFITRMGNGLLTRYLTQERGALDDTQKQRVARFKTIFSVSRNVLRIAVWTPAILLIIVELDVDIMPILVSVGVLSVGLSFGVQSLVKDLVTGFFMLLEDAFAVGDLMIINGQMGRIESLTVRVVRLRATDGSLFTFPYGNITSICNQNRDFSAVVTYFQVGIDADIDQVFDILDKISKDLRKDPSMRKLVTHPIEINGVNEVNDHALEIRAVLKTKPGEYFKVKWAFNRLLKQYLSEYDVPQAIPRSTSYNYHVEK